MLPLDRTFWLQTDAAPASTGCGRCPSTADGLSCQADRGVPCPEPRLHGEADAVARVLQALRGVADDEGNLVDTRRFSALRVDADEVELTLTFPKSCSPTRVLAEDAFQALRRALPDTDVYVRLAD